jgi:2-hydroxy-6-oxonona-2,4-dienedioate hydrolase
MKPSIRVSTLNLFVFCLLLVATPLLAQAQSAPVEKDVTIYGAKVHYAEAGSGPTVILLHGLGGSWQNWAFNIAPLAAKYRVIALDQIGFGKSDKPMINYRIGTYVDFLDQFYKQLKIERASLVGNSMGGWIAAAYTAAHPEKVDRLVLEDAAGYAPPANFDYKVLYNLNPSTRDAMKQVARLVFYNQALFGTEGAIDQAMAARINAGDGYTIKGLTESIIRGEDFVDEQVRTIKQPTLILWGKQDGLTPVSDGERFKRDISNSTLLVIDQCGHLPNVEKATEFNAAMLKFLGGQ